MTHHSFNICGATLHARASGALWQPDNRTLCVSDLHLGKSGRVARRNGNLLPPYETIDTLNRLADEISATDPATVICLGDSFDDLTASSEITPSGAASIAQMQAGRTWVWIEGNHDPGPVSLGGSHVVEQSIDPLTFRHIATGQTGEISGHYHPKFGIAGAGPPRACFLYDARQVIMPAFGTFTGGLHATDPALTKLFKTPPIAVLTGPRAIAVPTLKAPSGRRSRGRFY